MSPATPSGKVAGAVASAEHPIITGGKKNCFPSLDSSNCIILTLYSGRSFLVYPPYLPLFTSCRMWNSTRLATAVATVPSSCTPPNTSSFALPLQSCYRFLLINRRVASRCISISCKLAGGCIALLWTPWLFLCTSFKSLPHHHILLIVEHHCASSHKKSHKDWRLPHIPYY